MPEIPFHHPRSLEDILLKDKSIRPGILEFMGFYGEYVSLTDIQSVWRDAHESKNIGLQHVVQLLIESAAEVPFSHIEPILCDEHIGDVHFGSLIRKSLPISGDFECIRSILRKYKNPYIHFELGQKIKSIYLEDFVGLMNDSDLKSSNTLWNVLAGCVSPVHFRKLEPVLRDANIGVSIRGALAKSMEEVDFSEVRQFIFDDAISPFIRQKVAERICPISFRMMKDILVNPDVSDMVQIGISQRVDQVDFREVETFLANEYLEFDIRVSLADKIRPISLDDIRAFLLNADVDSVIRSFVAKKIYPISLETGILFLENVDVEPDILYEVANKVEYPPLDFYEFFREEQKVECHALQINAFQRDLISLDGSEEIPKKRTLVLYFREGQGGFLPHVSVLAPLLKKYTEGYSSVWNDFKIFTRYGGISDIGGIPCEYPIGIDFRSASTIYADTIHMSHGKPEQGVPGTHFILGDAVRCDEQKMSGITGSQYTSLPLLYYGGSSMETVKDMLNTLGFGFPSLDIEEIARIFFETLKEAEEKIMKNAGISRTVRYSESISEKIETLL